MEIRIKTTDYQTLPEVSAYLDSKLAHLEKLLGAEADVTRCEVELGRDAGKPRHGANIWFAEIQIFYPGGKLAKATNRSESINGAIDDAQVEVERQIRKEKQLHMRVLRKGGTFAKRLLRLD
jgi:ribosomal subunit interface protein